VITGCGGGRVDEVARAEGGGFYRAGIRTTALPNSSPISEGLPTEPTFPHCPPSCSTDRSRVCASPLATSVSLARQGSEVRQAGDAEGKGQLCPHQIGAVLRWMAQ